MESWKFIKIEKLKSFMKENYLQFSYNTKTNINLIKIYKCTEKECPYKFKHEQNILDSFVSFYEFEKHTHAIELSLEEKVSERRII